MYCPRCGAPSNDDMKFCRACGENLTVVAQAMSRRLPVTLVSKLDDYLERKHERLRRDSILTGLSGSFLLLSGLWQWTHAAGWPTVFMLLGALILFLVSAWDFVAYKRSQIRKGDNQELPPHFPADELPSKTEGQILGASVTEDTTRHLQPTKDRRAEKI